MKLILLSLVSLLLIFSAATAKENIANFPASQLYFVENKGQITDQYGISRKDIQYAMQTQGLNVFIGGGGIHYQFSKPGIDGKIETYRMDVVLQGAMEPTEVLSESLPCDLNYRTAATREMVTARTTTKVTYKNVYPGIDWAIYIKDGKLEYDFIVSEGASHSAIKMQYLGATTINMPSGGGMEIITPFGSVTEQTPVAYLENGAKIGSAFRLAGKTVSFKLAEHKGKVTIDPVIEWATYYGGAGGDYIQDVTTDASGNVYVCGQTNGTNNIATTGAHQQTFGGGLTDGFIAKFNAGGVRQWASYYGDTGVDNLHGITCDNTGNVFVCGTSTSGNIDAGVVHQSTMYGSSDAIMLKMTSNGQLLFCTYYGGYSSETGMDISCDANNNVFLSGSTKSGNFIATPGTHQAFQFGNEQAYLVKFDNAGVRQWGTYFGGSLDESSQAIAIDSAGYIYMVGSSTSSDYISTTGAFQTTPQGGTSDGYLARFRNNNGQLSWGTYVGDIDLDMAIGVATGPGYSVYVTGATQSGAVLHTTGTQQQTFNGTSDCYLLRFDSAGNRVWGTYYGGTQFEEARDVHCAADGSVWIVGMTGSSTVIATVDGYQTTLASNVDGFFARFTDAGIRTYGSYYGGVDNDATHCVHAHGNAVYIGGWTYGPGTLSTVGAHQVSSGGFDDGILAKIIECTVPAITASGPLTFCQSDSVVLSGPVGSGYTYQWMLNGANISGANDTTYTVTAGGIYSVAVTTSACGLDTSFPIQVTVNPLPVPTITNVGTTLSTGIYTNYQWNLNGNPVSGANSQTYNASQGGPYTVTVTDGNGCIGTSAPMTLSVADVENAKQLMIYPNPTNGMFTVKGNFAANEKEVSVTITDVAGRVVLSSKANVKAGIIDKELSLPTSTPAGIYILKLSGDSDTRVLPFRKN